MSDSTSIEWTDATWNPTRGCSRVSEGCRNCYAERFSARFATPSRTNRDGEKLPGRYHGFVKQTREGPRWTGRVEIVESQLDRPLKYRRPMRIFVDSMSDLFHEALADDAIDRVFAVMALATRHTFQVLTKRPERMHEYARRIAQSVPHDVVNASVFDATNAQHGGFSAWPLPNVWLGVSVEDQVTADARIPLLLNTPAAKRFVSFEPALGPVDFTELDVLGIFRRPHSIHDPAVLWNALTGFVSGPGEVRDHLDWVIVGGESGPGARPFNVEWARSTVSQCKAAGVACFVKQLGNQAIDDEYGIAGAGLKVAPEAADLFSRRLTDHKGGDWSEWPEDLRVRQFPAAVRAGAPA